jgi:sensor domain CHASE-containing protein
MNQQEIQMLQFVYENYQYGVYILAGVLCVATVVASITKTKKDDNFLRRVIKNFRSIVWK